MNDNKNTLCVQAFASPNVNFSRNEHRMCCHTKGVPVNQQTIDFHGTALFAQLEPLVKTKRDLLSGIRSPDCSYCWKIEDAGGNSPRSTREEFVNYMVNTTWFGTKDRAEIEHRLNTMTEHDIECLSRYLDHPEVLEIALTNTCDLKCVYCSPHFSTQWEAELSKYKELRIVDTANPSENFQAVFWKYFLESGFRHTRFISFIGGEPLIIDDFYQNLELILDKYESYDYQDELPYSITINVITNLNCQEKYFRKLLNLIPRVLANPRLEFHIGVSFESVADKSEFIRTGTKWHRFANNMEELYKHVSMLPTDQKSRIELGCHATINSLAVSGLPAFFTFLINIRNKYGIHVRLYNNQVVYPSWLSPGILPADFARYVDESIELIRANTIDYPGMHSSSTWDSYCIFLVGIRNLILSTDKDIHALSRFPQEIDKLCHRRKLNFHETFPEMVNFYNSLK